MPPRRCRVLAAFPTCLYLDLGAHERVLAVLASDAVALPIGLRLALPSTRSSAGVSSPARTSSSGRGAYAFRAPTSSPRGSAPVPRAPARRGSAGDRRGLPEPGVLGDLAHDLTAAALAGRPVEPGVRGLVGVGRGLTPSGDDALCGVLLPLAAVDAPHARRRARRPCAPPSAASLPWTTSLSAALLVAAGAGYAVPDVARLVTRRRGRVDLPDDGRRA